MTLQEQALLTERRLQRQLRKEIDRDLQNMRIATRIWRMAALTRAASELWLNSALAQLMAGLEVVTTKQKALEERNGRLEMLSKEVAELAVQQRFIPVGLLVTVKGTDGRLDWASFQA